MIPWLQLSAKTISGGADTSDKETLGGAKKTGARCYVRHAALQWCKCKLACPQHVDDVPLCVLTSLEERLPGS